MSLRPRYSLLTLLVLTALVAGGVKLWYGPHRVIERIAEDREEEYTYTRDLLGEKIIHGPHVIRKFQAISGQLWSVEVTYYRQGARLNWRYLNMDTIHNHGLPFHAGTFAACPLTDAENLEFLVVVEREKNRPVDPGKQRFEELCGGFETTK